MRYGARAAVLLLALAGLVSGHASADAPTGQPVTPTPHQVVAERVPVVRVAVEDAQALLDQIQRLAASRPPSEAARGERAEGAVSRLIRLDVPTVVNRGSRFVFRDVTPRDAAPATLPGARRSMRDRQDAVEKFRQGLSRQRRAAGTRR